MDYIEELQAAILNASWCDVNLPRDGASDRRVSRRNSLAR